MLCTNTSSFFWHQAMRKAFTGHASYLVNNILRLPKRGPISRYAIIYVSFMMSALMHTAITPGHERCLIGPQLTLYHCIIAAVVLEDVVIAKCRAASGQRVVTTDTKEIPEKIRSQPRTIDVKDAHQTTALLWKLVGYSWVASFWMWSGSNLMFALYTTTCW